MRKVAPQEAGNATTTSDERVGPPPLLLHLLSVGGFNQACGYWVMDWKGLLKRGFLIGSRRSRGGVCGPSPIWLKLGRVTRGNLKSCQETIFWHFVACQVI